MLHWVLLAAGIFLALLVVAALVGLTIAGFVRVGERQLRRRPTPPVRATPATTDQPATVTRVDH